MAGESVTVVVKGDQNKSYGTIPTSQEDSTQSKPSSCLCDCLYSTAIFFLQSYIYFVSYYCAESPGGLENTIINVMGVDTTHYDLLLSVSAWPNIILCLVGGIIVDRVLGIRASYIMVIITTVVGQIIWSLGAFLDNFWIMLAGRFCSGMGTEMTDVVASAFIANRFNVAISFSILYAAARLGGALGLAAPQFLYELLGFVGNSLSRLGITILFGGFLMMTAFAACVTILVMDKQKQQQAHGAGSKIKCDDLNQFSVPYWLTVAVLSLYCPTFFSFVGVSQVFFIQKFALSPVASGIANSLTFCATIMFSPIVALLINYFGYYILWVILGILFSLSAHLLFIVNYQWTIPYIAGVINSMSYTIIIPSLWSLPAILVEPSQAATAYGFVHCGYNVVMSVLTVVTGLLVDHAGYFMLEVTFVIILYVALAISIALWMMDMFREKPVVGAPGKCRKNN